MTKPQCPNLECPIREATGVTRIVSYGFYRTRSGKRRRYRCLGCGRTFASTTSTPYYRLQHRRRRFDIVVALRVEGVSISAIARVQGLAWNTVARWLERAAAACRGFNQHRLAGYGVEELQADELRAFVGGKTHPTWMFVAIEVWSRLWPATVTGRRSYRNTLALLRDIADRMKLDGCPLIVTDGFEFYEKVVRRLFGGAALYGQVLKTRRNDRVIKVERRVRLGPSWRFAEVFSDSEDSATLNTSFVERLNLTIRQGLAYLSRRTLAQARSEKTLAAHLELLRCHYNFIRPHGALKFGKEIRTPAMQAGLARQRLTFRKVFGRPPSFLAAVCVITCAVPNRGTAATPREQLLAASATLDDGSTDTTLNVYTQVLDGSARVAVDKVGSELFTIVHKPKGATELTH